MLNMRLKEQNALMKSAIKIFYVERILLLLMKQMKEYLKQASLIPYSQNGFLGAVGVG
jgi:hypothetical protein